MTTCARRARRPEALVHAPAHEYGNHILASTYLETDNATILREATRFLSAVQAR